MAVKKHSTLQALPEEAKRKLKQLTERFDFDWSDARVYEGEEARHVIAEMEDPDRPEKWLIVRAQQERIRKQQNGTARINDDRPFQVGMYVAHINDPDKARYKIVEMEKKDFGRTGWWCKIQGVYDALPLKRLREAAELELCPLGD